MLETQWDAYDVFPRLFQRRLGELIELLNILRLSPECALGDGAREKEARVASKPLALFEVHSL
jgi:hypothetical protein